LKKRVNFPSKCSPPNRTISELFVGFARRLQFTRGLGPFSQVS
jgi:hypothetical protein